MLNTLCRFQQRTITRAHQNLGIPECSVIKLIFTTQEIITTLKGNLIFTSVSNNPFSPNQPVGQPYFFTPSGRSKYSEAEALGKHLKHHCLWYLQYTHGKRKAKLFELHSAQKQLCKCRGNVCALVLPARSVHILKYTG